MEEPLFCKKLKSCLKFIIITFTLFFMVCITCTNTISFNLSSDEELLRYRILAENKH